MTIIEYEAAVTDEEKDNIVAGKAVVIVANSIRICVHCDVTWVGYPDSQCWICGRVQHIPQPGERWTRKVGGATDSPLTILSSPHPGRVAYAWTREDGREQVSDTDREMFISEHFYLAPR